MKAIAFNGSARKDGNMAIMTRWVFDELEKEGIETELYQMKGKQINGCIACYKCFENKDQRCAVKKDDLNECIEKMVAADAIILAASAASGRAETSLLFPPSTFRLQNSSTRCSMLRAFSCPQAAEMS